MGIWPIVVFEFILVLVTVIVSLGITELLDGVVSVLRHELKPGHLHWQWVWLIFNVLIQWLWFSRKYRQADQNPQEKRRGRATR